MPERKTFAAVTGAFSYTGKYIAAELLARERNVVALTGHPPGAEREDPFGGRVVARPLEFADSARLAESLRGAETLYNTYWIRFPRGAATYERAVANTRTLLAAARSAGVRRVVQISVTNPAPDSPLPYFRGKAEVEEAVRASGLSHAIIRPPLIFGREDILVNNVAWLLRRFPAFGLFGRGRYRVQPVYVGDLAALAVRLGGEDANVTLDAVGPEVLTYAELVRLVRNKIKSRALVLPLPPSLALLAGRALGLLLADVIITRNEIAGLMAGLLVSSGEPTCPTRFSEWLDEHADALGRRYASEIRRHYR